MKISTIHMIIFSLILATLSFTTDDKKIESYIHIFRPEEDIQLTEEPISQLFLSGEHLNLCNYNDLENLIIAKAKAKNANVIKIHHVKRPSKSQNCFYVEASIYKIHALEKYTNEIIWRADERLTWNEFKGKYKKDRETIAITHSGILINSEFHIEQNRVIPKVHAVFDCHHSWVHPGHTEDGDLLNHEQKHFDISELYARKLRMSLSKVKLTTQNYDKVIKKLYNDNFESLNKFQDAYDDATHHGIDKNQQKIWDNLVEEELKKLDEYSNNL